MKKLFNQLVETINNFTPDEPITLESKLENRLRLHLQKESFNVSQQVVKRRNRYDLLCRLDNEVVCIEMKLRTTVTDLQQFDKYLPKFKDGLIVVCWQASFTVKDVFKNVKKQSPIPVELIELSQKYSLV